MFARIFSVLAIVAIGTSGLIQPLADTLGVQNAEAVAAAFTASTSTPLVTRGSEIEAILTVTNQEATAQNLFFAFHLPVGLTLSRTEAPLTCSSTNPHVCNFSLAAGQTQTFRMFFRVSENATLLPCGTQFTVAFDLRHNDGTDIIRVINAHVNCPPVTSSAASSAVSSVASSAVSSVASSVFSATSSKFSSAVSSVVSSVQSSAVSSVISSVASSAVSSVASSAVSSAPQQPGCIDVRKETFKPNGDILTPVAQFTFTLDNGQTVFNDSSGVARFNNITPGQHTVTENIPAGWVQTSITPANGIVNVTSGSVCAAVVFKNRQIIPTFAITKTDGRTIVKYGEEIVYTITIANTSPVTATDIIVTDTLPSDVVFVSADQTQWIQGTTNASIITWKIPSIAANQSQTLVFRAKLKENVADGTVLRNVAQVGTITAEDTTIVTVEKNEDIEISIKDNPDPVRPGKKLTYTLEVCNDGDEDIEVDVKQILDDQTDFEEASGEDSEDEIDEDDIDEDDGTITWEDVEIDEDECIDLESIVTVDDDADDGDKLHTTATADGATDDEVTRVDDDEDDDDDDNGISILKDVDYYEVLPGQTVEYSLTIENTGDSTLEDIEVEDTIQSSYISIIDDGGADRSGNTLRWTIDELEEGKSRTLRYRIAVGANAPIGQSIYNNAKVTVDDLEDEASVTVIVIGELPQTGFGGYSDGSSYLKPYKGKGGSTAGTLSIVATLAMTGIGAGVGIGRKFLI